MVTAEDAGMRLGEERLRRLLEVGRTLVAELQLESVLRQGPAGSIIRGYRDQPAGGG